MLPEQSLNARQAADRACFIHQGDVPEEVLSILKRYLPAALTEDGEWVDLSVFPGTFGSENTSGMTELLHPL
jgi:hypothetical protein